MLAVESGNNDERANRVGTVTFWMESASLKARRPMLVTLFGMETVVSAVQDANASSPIVLTPSGMERVVNPEQYWQNSSTSEVVPLLTVTEDNDVR